MKEIIKDVVKYLPLCVLLFTGSPAAAATPAAQRYDVGDGLHLSIRCQGRGSPTVVLDAGLGQSAASWSKIQEGLSPTARVCAFDRAGYGASDVSLLPRTSGRIATELRTLLARAGVDPPFLLGGHSFGGYNMRMFASLFSRDSVGLVLIDTPHEAQIEQILQTQFFRQIDPSGLLGQLWQPGLVDLFTGVNMEGISSLFGVRQDTLKAIIGEMAGYRESSTEIRHNPVPAELPITVIMHGRRVLPSGELGDEMEHRWSTLYRELARKHGGRFIVARNSGHDIPFSQPDLVISTLRDMVENVRKSRN